ncbi:MAG: flagellar basal body protein [Desulfoarculaceae bacterium]|nr:flagellar basal body protein [Desulfoarculaceae bacterium]
MMIHAIKSALSGLSAYSTTISVNASNIANAGTEGFKKKSRNPLLGGTSGISGADGAGRNSRAGVL